MQIKHVLSGGSLQDTGLNCSRLENNVLNHGIKCFHEMGNLKLTNSTIHTVACQ